MLPQSHISHRRVWFFCIPELLYAHRIWLSWNVLKQTDTEKSCADMYPGKDRLTRETQGLDVIRHPYPSITGVSFTTNDLKRKSKVLVATTGWATNLGRGRVRRDWPRLFVGYELQSILPIEEEWNLQGLRIEREQRCSVNLLGWVDFGEQTPPDRLEDWNLTGSSRQLR